MKKKMSRVKKYTYILFPLMYLVMKIDYYYQILRILIMQIQNFNRFMTNKTKHHSKKHFCWYCLQCFSSSKLLEWHVRNCLPINHTKSVFLPEEGQYLVFWIFRRLIKAPFIIYADVECVLILLAYSIKFGPNTKRYNGYIVHSYG